MTWERTHIPTIANSGCQGFTYILYHASGDIFAALAYTQPHFMGQGVKFSSITACFRFLLAASSSFSCVILHSALLSRSTVIPHIVRWVQPLLAVSCTCTVMINSLETPIHINLLEDLRKQPVRLRLKQACPGAKLPPPLLECRLGQLFEDWSSR